ncbi:MAG: bifunctional diaminohydroxyphosphoribosylaminopyrimidine deaminase/5-amino-6-(5-phosphoribosylamino)uracil reductase RibD [Acidobacteriota bacterium]
MTGGPVVGPEHRARVLELAERGLGRVAPNPPVGALVLDEAGTVVGEGYHVLARRHHAEVAALEDAGDRARGGTVVVSLEPCSSHGRTPPCSDALLAAGIRRLVALLPDPDPRHRGRGFELLREAGMEVVVEPAGSPWREKAAVVVAAFCCRAIHRRPLVTLKAATSLDGRVAAASGESQWITGESARRRVHELRRDAQAVLVGVGTVLADDPRLTVRLPGVESDGPLRVVLDPRLRTPPTARLFAEPDEGEAGGPVLVVHAEDAEPGTRERLRAAGAELLALPVDEEGGFDLPALLAALETRDVLELFVEGGGITAGRFLPHVDRLVLHLAPLVLGGAGPAAVFSSFGAESLADGVRFHRMEQSRHDHDIELEAWRDGGFDPVQLAAADPTA